MDRFELIIIGAGIVGAAAAREFAYSGVHVAIVEAGPPGAGITAAGMGHIVIMDDSQAQLALTTLSRELWRKEGLPPSVEYTSPGTIWVAADDDEMSEVLFKAKAFSEVDVRCEVLTGTKLAQLEPGLRARLAGGLLVPDDGVMYPPAAAAHFLQQAQAAGATLLQGRAIRAMDGVVALADGRRLSAVSILLATGIDCSLLPAMQLRRRKGHLVITDRYPGFLSHQLVELGYLKNAHRVHADSVAFNVQPRQTGQLLIGSSRQYSSDDPAVDREILSRMLARANEYMPGLKDLSVLRIWTGFRAATEDKLPLLGPAAGLSEDPSLWLATGFEGLGYTNALAAARLLADQMLHRTPMLTLEPYLPARLLASPQSGVSHA